MGTRKTKILLIFVCGVIYGCSDNVSKSRIGKYISESCLEQECDIDLSQVIKETWDTVYLFDQNSSLDFIRQTIKIDYNFIDVGRKIIFIKDDEIVYTEDEFPNPEMTKKNI